jgi:hypothetical protein
MRTLPAVSSVFIQTMRASPPAIDLRRLWWVGPLTILAAIVAVLAVRVIAFAVLELSPEFVPLAWGALITFTAVLVAAGVLVFAAVGRLAARPIQMYRRIALGALAVSMIPDLWLPGGSPGATWSAVLVLMAMHIVAWWPTVAILTRWTLRPGTSRTSA